MRANLIEGRWRSVRRAALDRDGWRCRTCNRAGRLEVDHVLAVVDGGPKYDVDNTQTLCRECHRAKTDKERRERGQLSRIPSRKIKLWRTFVDNLRLT